MFNSIMVNVREYKSVGLEFLYIQPALPRLQIEKGKDGRKRGKEKRSFAKG